MRLHFRRGRNWFCRTRIVAVRSEPVKARPMPVWEAVFKSRRADLFIDYRTPKPLLFFSAAQTQPQSIQRSHPRP